MTRLDKTCDVGNARLLFCVLEREGNYAVKLEDAANRVKIKSCDSQ